MADRDPLEAAKKLTEGLNLQSGQLEKIAQNLAKVNKEAEEAEKGIEEYIKKIEDLSKTYKQSAINASKMGDASEKNFLRMEQKSQKFLRFLKEYKDELSEPIKLVVNYEKAKGDPRRKKVAREEILEFLGGRTRGVVGGTLGGMGLGSKTLGGAADAFSNTWKQAKSVKNQFGGLVDMLKIAGEGAGMFAGALKLLGVVIKGNPIMLIVAGLSAVVSIVNEFDQMMKKMNQTWRAMAGSLVLTKNIRGAMQEFND